MLRYNRKTRCTLGGHSENLSFILDSFKNICIGQGHNNAHISSMKTDLSYPIKMHSRSYGFSLPRFGYLKIMHSAIYFRSYLVYPIPMSTMAKRSKIYTDNR